MRCIERLMKVQRNHTFCGWSVFSSNWCAICCVKRISPMKRHTHTDGSPLNNARCETIVSYVAVKNRIKSWINTLKTQLFLIEVGVKSTEYPRCIRFCFGLGTNFQSNAKIRYIYIYSIQLMHFANISSKWESSEMFAFYSQWAPAHITAKLFEFDFV